MISTESITEVQYDTKENEVKKKTYKWDIVWVRILLLGLLHIGAIYGLYLRKNVLWQSSLFGKSLGFMSNVGITAGAHRLWSHRAYKANTAMQALLLFLTTCTYQNSIYTWCRDHRLHHKYSETDADPHNAKRGFFFSHMGWLMVKKHEQVKIKGKTIDMSDLEANKLVMFQHKYYYHLVILMTFVIPSVIPWYFWGEDMAISFFTITLFRYVISVHLTWCINSLAHLYGNRPYDKKIGPTENPIMMYCGMGEGFHNYHHTFPWDYKAAEFGGVRNFTTFLIESFARIGWAYDLKSVPQTVIDERINTCGDESKNTKIIPSPSQKKFQLAKDVSLVLLFLYII